MKDEGMGRIDGWGWGLTKEGGAGWVGEMQCFTVLAEILRAGHQAPQGFKVAHGAGIDLSPGPAKAMDRCGAKGGDDRRQSGEVVHLATFLQPISP